MLTKFKSTCQRISLEDALCRALDPKTENAGMEALNISFPRKWQCVLAFQGSDSEVLQGSYIATFVLQSGIIGVGLLV